jgi:hypothetical protein
VHCLTDIVSFASKNGGFAWCLAALVVEIGWKEVINLMGIQIDFARSVICD